MSGLLARWGVSTGVVFALSLAGTAATDSATPGCQVRNVTQGTIGTSLVRLTRQAEDGDRLRVRGTCAGPIVVSADISIRGVGDRPTLTGRGRDRVLEVRPDVTASIRDLTIRDGFAWDGAGITNAGTLTLTGVVVRDNRAGPRDTCGRTPDPTCDYRRGDPNKGGGILNEGTLEVRGSRVTGNESARGGGIFNRGSLTLRTSTVARNFASQWTEGLGGGIFNKGEMRVRRSTIARNLIVSGEEGAAGGGIFNAGALDVADSTISSNRAFGGNTGRGGGIANGSSQGACSGGVTVTSSTITRNEGRSWIDRNEAGGGLYNGWSECPEPGTVTVRTTIVTDNGRDCWGTFISDGHNVIGAAPKSCNGFEDGNEGDQVGSVADPIDARLGPLADNGGPTLTHALLRFSRAIDHAGPAPCASGRDQRLWHRPQKYSCDVGAIERHHQGQ